MLEPVGGIKAKLKAFRREYDSGSLLIYHKDSRPAVEEFLPLFTSDGGSAWEVSSCKDLADRLKDAGLVDQLLETHTITLDSIEAIKRQVRFLEKDESRLGEANDLVRRAMTCLDENTPLRTSLALVRTAEDLNRHSGRFAEAIEQAEQYLNGDFEKLASYEDEVTRDYRLAASYYDAHRFEDSHRLITPWIKKLQNDSKIIAIETLPKLLNTQALNLVVLGFDGWEELFTWSKDIQIGLQSPDISRTRNYLIKSYLHAGKLDEAEAEIGISLGEDDLSKASSHHLQFLRADLARRRGKVWPETCNDIQPVAEHALAFFYQAYARQPNDAARSEEILQVAAVSLDQGLDNDPANIKCFLATCCRLAAFVYSNKEDDARQQLELLQGYLEQDVAQNMKPFYQVAIQNLSNDLSITNVDLLFDRVPHF